MWVVKLGGSLQYSKDLKDWLDVITRYGMNRVVIVPGGGRFADEVRSAQRHWRFDDKTAHRMAILAMHQFGLLLTGLNPYLRTVPNPEIIQTAEKKDYIPVWLPNPAHLEQNGLAASWDVTSDSLSAWLATTINAEQLFLVKSVMAPAAGTPLSELVSHDIIDKAFIGCVNDPSFSITIYGPDDQERLINRLKDEN